VQAEKQEIREKVEQRGIYRQTQKPSERESAQAGRTKERRERIQNEKTYSRQAWQQAVQNVREKEKTKRQKTQVTQVKEAAERGTHREKR